MGPIYQLLSMWKYKLNIPTKKSHLSQNVMGVCSFDHKFQYVLAGWEGSATDSRVLALALSRLNPIVVSPSMSNHLINDYIVLFLKNEAML